MVSLVRSALLTSLGRYRYEAELETLRVSTRACQQFTYWALADCGAAGVRPPVGPDGYPTTDDIDTFVKNYDVAVHAHQAKQPLVRARYCILSRLAFHTFLSVGRLKIGYKPRSPGKQTQRRLWMPTKGCV
jgi:hypothetical protein